MSSSRSKSVFFKIGELVLGPDLRGKSPNALHGTPIDHQTFAPSTIGSRIASLVAEHSDLDQAVSALLEAGSCDDLLITRLKKRKLQIKDEIACAESSARPGQETVTQHDQISWVA